MRNVFPRLAGADSDDDRPLVHGSSPHHEVLPSNTIPTSSSAVVEANPGPHRRRRRVCSDGSESGLPGAVVHHDLTLIDSSDDDAPFTVPRLAAAPARPSRRLVLVPESADATPQSIQDLEVGQFPSGPEFCSGTSVSLESVHGFESAPDVHVMTDGSLGSTESDTISLAGEPRNRRRRLSLVWDNTHENPDAREEEECQRLMRWWRSQFCFRP